MRRSGLRFTLGCTLGTFGAIVPALFTAPLAAQGAWKNLVGKAMPAFQAGTWLNTDGAPVTIETLRGKVWLFEFFATTCGPCMGKVEDLSGLHQKYFARGFRVVAMSSEPADLLRKEVVEKRGAKYWIGTDENGTGVEPFIEGHGSIGIPHFVFVDAGGKVVGHEVPTEAEIEKLLDDALVRDLDRELGPKLAAGRAWYDAGAYGAAFVAAKSLLKDPEPAVVADANFLIERIEICAKHDRDRLGDLPPAEQPEIFVKLLLAARLYEGHPLGGTAQDLVKKREGSSGIKPHRDAFAALDKALRQEIRSIGWPSERKTAEKAYEELLKKHAGVAAEVARERLEALKKRATPVAPAGTPGGTPAATPAGTNGGR